MLTALNLDLRDEYVADCANGVRRWNQALEDAGLEERLILPHEGFNRRVGVYAEHHVSPEGEVLDDEHVGATRGRLPARRPRTAPAVADADGAGVRARQVRRLDRAAVDRHQRPAGRVRLRAPRRGGRRVMPAREAPDAHLGPRGQPDLGRRQAARDRVGARRAPSTCPSPTAPRCRATGGRRGPRTGRSVGYGWLDATWGGDAEILLAVDAAGAGAGRRLASCSARLEDEAAAPRAQLRLQHGPRRAPAARRRARLARGPRLPRRRQSDDRPCASGSAPAAGARAVDGPCGRTSGPPRSASAARRTTRRARATMAPGHEESGGYVDVDDHRY